MTTTVPARTAARAPRADFRPSFARQTALELRKMVDTRAGVSLVAIIAALVVVASFVPILLGLAIEELSPPSWGDSLSTATGATSFLLPILGILTVTSEWGQRTVLTTFTLEPRRLRVMAAKTAAGIMVALAATLLAAAWATVITPVGGAILGEAANWSVEPRQVLAATVSQVLGLLAGMALAALILNTPAAICAHVGCVFVLPMVLVGLSLWEPAAQIAPWLDFTSAQSALGAPMAAEQWGQLAVSGGIFLVLPMVLGWVRIARSEIS